MKFTLYFLLICTISKVICQDEYGCEDECPCAEPVSDIPENTLITKGDGCIWNITCASGPDTFVSLDLTDAGIDIPPNSGYLMSTYSVSDLLVPGGGPHIDMSSYFGMVCENNIWYLTKYPNGLIYLDEASMELKSYGNEFELEGKLIKVTGFTCGKF